MQKLDRFIYKFFLYFAMACFVALFGVLLFNVLIRQARIPVTTLWYTEVVEMLFAYMVMFTSVALAHDKQHFKVDLLLQFFGKHKHFHIIEVITNIIAFAFFVLLFVYGVRLTASANQTMVALRIAKRWAYLSIPIGSFFMAIFSLRDMVESFLVFVGKKNLPVQQ